MMIIIIYSLNYNVINETPFNPVCDYDNCRYVI